MMVSMEPLTSVALVSKLNFKSGGEQKCQLNVQKMGWWTFYGGGLRHSGKF